MSFDFAFTPSRGADRSRALREGREAVAITERGAYVTPAGHTVDLVPRIARMLEGTLDLPAEVALPEPAPRARASTVFRVVNGTTLEAASALAAARDDEPFVLNFASAKKPGGGFLNGARAQEESLARASTLYASLLRSRMYGFHRERHDALYTGWMILSPHVTIIRDDDGRLLETPFDATFLTGAAPNAGVVLARAPSRKREVETAMDARIDRCLAIAHAFGHRRLVLGAWGCGVFQNDPSYVARSFARALRGPFDGIFDEVVFAVLDWSPLRRFVRPFVECFDAPISRDA